MKAQKHENHKQPSKSRRRIKKEKFNFHIWRNFCKFRRDDTARELCWFAFVPPIQLRNWNRRLHKQRSAFSFSSVACVEAHIRVQTKRHWQPDTGPGQVEQVWNETVNNTSEAESQQVDGKKTSSHWEVACEWRTQRHVGVRRSIATQTFDNFSVNIDRQAGMRRRNYVRVETFDDVAPTFRLKWFNHLMTTRDISLWLIPGYDSQLSVILKC